MNYTLSNKVITKVTDNTWKTFIKARMQDRKNNPKNRIVLNTGKTLEPIEEPE